MAKRVNILVFAHIGLIALGLLFPALVKVRDKATGSRCAGNLRELMRAAQNYANDYDTLPSATCGNHPEVPHERRFSWHLMIEPYLHRDVFYFLLSDYKSWDDPEIRLFLLWKAAYKHCPANPHWRAPTHECATHYVGIAGVGKDAPELPAERPRAGAFGYDRKVKLSEFPRGLSDTVAAAETATQIGPWVAGGFPTVRGLDPEGAPYFGPTGQFSSLHTNATNVLFCDYSVRVFTPATDPKIFEGLATLAGHLPVVQED